MSSRSKSLMWIVAAATVVVLVGWYTLRDPGQVEPGDNGRISDPPAPPSGLLPDSPDLPGDLPQTPAPEPTGFFAVFGSVVTFDGAPAKGVGIGVVRVWPGGADLYRLPKVRTDGGGKFRIERVPVGGARLGVFPDLPSGLNENDLKEQPVVLTRPIVGPDGGEVDAGVIILERSGTIEGVVLDEAGETCVRAVVVVGKYVAGLGRRNAKTDHEGRFRFEDLPAGEYFVHASFRVLGLDKGLRSKRIDRVTPGTTNLVIELTTPSAVVLEFHSSEEPNEPLLVHSGRLFPVGGSVAYRFGQAANPTPIAKWVVNLPPASYHLKFTSEGYRPVDIGQVTVFPDQETTVNVVLSPE